MAQAVTRRMQVKTWVVGVLLAALIGIAPADSRAQDAAFRAEFPQTDFSKMSIDFDEIVTDGPRRDDIPPIHEPKFVAVAEADIGPQEPVIGIVINGDARAYPLRILLWHEIVNDVVGGVPVLVSYCPLCNSGVVFDRRLDGRVLKFGNTGRIRYFDMVMYDIETQSWWQQFLGEAIVGNLTGARLNPLPARLESVAAFRERAPQGKLLVPNDARIRPYGASPYVGFENETPRAVSGYGLPDGIRPLDRVVIVGKEAWPLAQVRSAGVVRVGDLEIRWTPGQNSIHDKRTIAQSRDVGNVVVQRGGVDVPYDVTFAFAHRAFNGMNAVIHQ
ncbi:MAG: DUF3179 domain-containing protein [Proteobacteria bacterium]|nr:DUF3179 domain-containing protein [Pseudomonadota bacterium]MDA1059244.1 DUF3179 domain-containing protein [Pseudomonadota bacterium]